MTMALVMVLVVGLLAGAACVAGDLLISRITGMSRADRNKWKPVTRGPVAARRRRYEAALVDRLTRRRMSRTDYHRAMSDLARADATRCPVHVPRTKQS